ncbi:acyltransferase [Ruminococcus sp. CLA-AA-H200]|uniref:Acyltransferase n=1 Tax=Ruminococcus turbiniformis TaxID=2881258 RepID=A0ABS8FX25_9FIRM|nr:acyltransferase [Ruminococcus turbiniformis]MCC2254139.1 acyltransferase [Ruminococcus turbiniformis]
MKNSGISAIRGIATLMIVCCHLMQGLDNELAFWLNVGVQIFLCMSGYLYGKKQVENTVAWYKRQYLKIMKPVWILLTVLAAVILIGQFSDLSVISLGLSYLGLAGFGTLPELTHTWFITYILFCYLLTPLLQMIDIASEKKTWKFVLSLIVFVGIAECLYLSRIVMLMPQYLSCYIVGYYFSRREAANGGADLKKLTAIVAAIAVVTLPIRLLVQYGGIEIPMPGWQYIRTQITDWHHTLLGIALFFGLLLLFTRKKPGYTKILEYSDKYSYYIYLVHQIFILNTFSLLHVTPFLFLNLLLIAAAVLLSAAVLRWVTERLVIKKKAV